MFVLNIHTSPHITAPSRTPSFSKIQMLHLTGGWFRWATHPKKNQHQVWDSLIIPGPDTMENQHDLSEESGKLQVTSWCFSMYPAPWVGQWQYGPISLDRIRSYLATSLEDLAISCLILPYFRHDTSFKPFASLATWLTWAQREDSERSVS